MCGANINHRKSHAKFCLECYRERVKAILKRNSIIRRRIKREAKS